MTVLTGVDIVVTTLAIHFPAGVYGCHSLVALATLRNLPVVVIFYDDDGQEVGRAKMNPRFRRRVRLYAWPGVLWLGWAVSRVLTDIATAIF